MKTIVQKFSVPFQYNVAFTEGLFERENDLLATSIRPYGKDPAKCLVFVDDGVSRSFPELAGKIELYFEQHSHLNLMRPAVVVPGGERVKNDEIQVQRAQRLIDDNSICRHSYCIAVGGGAVLDTIGYAAATAHRGIRLIRVPTTVLAQNDSGVGVKNGINAFGKKNFLGAFMPPAAVLNDFQFLTTLDDRDWRSGIAEALKVALIKDASFYNCIRENAEPLAGRDMAAMKTVIYRCAEMHLEHIATNGDPFEFGSSRPLDFGHWAAHRLEHLTDYRLRHGEAVAIGISLDVAYSTGIGLLTATERDDILHTFASLGFDLFAPEMAHHIDEPGHPQGLFAGLTEFREHLGGELTLMMLERIGRGREVHEAELPAFREAIRFLEQFQRRRRSA